MFDSHSVRQTNPTAMDSTKRDETDSARMNESETDAKLFTKILGKKDKDDQIAPDGPAIHDEEYRMDHKRRGKALIFNHWRYEDPNLKQRAGADVDQNKLVVELKRLGFEVDICENYKYSLIKEKLRQVAEEEDHSDEDCLVVVVMSHGKSGELHAYDGAYKENKLWGQFSGDKCPQLRGKPKLFFIQACRGDQTDGGSKLQTKKTQTDSKPTKEVTYTIPNTADLLIAHATFDGYFAWRNTGEGSWFVQALCQELRENGTKHDVLRLMTSVNRKVAITFQSYSPERKDMDKKKQMSTVLSTLTRLLYFRPKTEIKNLE